MCQQQQQIRRGQQGQGQGQGQAGNWNGNGNGNGINGGRVTKGEVVRRWVLDVPIGVLPPSSMSPVAASTMTTTTTTMAGAGGEKGNVVPQPAPEVHDPLRDPAEAVYALGGDQLVPEDAKAQDKDNQLYTIADNLIKSQLARIDVPLLGVLNLDDSDSESSEEEEEEEEEEYEDEYEEDYEEGDEEYEDEEEYEDGEGEEEEENVVYECVYGNDQGPKVKVSAVPSVHQHHQQQPHTKVETAVMSPEGMGSVEVQLGTAGSGSAGRKRGASEIS